MYTPQVSWMLLQASHLPDADIKRTLMLHLPPDTLESFLDAVMSSPSLPHGVQWAVARNCCWALLGLLGNAADPSSPSGGQVRTPRPTTDDIPLCDPM